MLAVQDVRLDPTSRQVWRGDREIRLSRKEFQLLHALMARPGDIVTRGDADMVALARALLDDPRWGWHAAEALGAEIPRPPQYARAAPAVWPGAALVRPREDDEFRRSA